MNYPKKKCFIITSNKRTYIMSDTVIDNFASCLIHIVLSLIHILAHEFLGTDVEGKDMIIIDDMISSGGSVIDVAKELKSRKAGRIFICATFGLFTNGMDKFDQAYEEGLFDFVLTTNLVYQLSLIHI